MNREILFRGKANIGIWVYGDLITKKYPIFPTLTPPIILDNDGAWDVIPETVGQQWEPSHGLKLFTGDLLKAICAPSGSKDEKERLCKVISAGSGMDIAVWHEGEWWAYGSMDFTSVRKIGNIHDNPELLNK